MSRCPQCRCETCQGPTCLNKTPLLSNLTREEADKISAGVSSKVFHKGETLFHAGDTADRLYIVCSGKVKLLKHTAEGKEQILYILKAGDFFGAFNLLKEDRFDCTAEALTDSLVSMLKKSEFDRIILSNPEITLKVFEKAYERIIKLETLIERLSTASLDARVAGLLLSLIPDFGTHTPEGTLLKLSISREDMGSYSGIARETMSRKLHLFDELGYIQLKSTRQILIKDLAGLQSLLHESHE
ncbi:Crp/Fnr family transcriptional regulator [Anoxynatronum sibiricum]|uniref:Crp/Fnr family transcriptional regulator n=1 Tax=Anoxynatronum sibiricum TaxID=210623 RepID=A0ABU9VY39_9CLOT